ncbi:protease-4 [Zhouia amylolytica]|uniref:Protease-4 n=1 Tax=Zhouia amylolytica TaxID=376730 RepID=A0A1I6VNS7_9FLAO|nr:signal peptide peptidase SppA [Zhouia amylolytica]SFT15307.1 protease-4 [Zhouia amylolytica]
MKFLRNLLASILGTLVALGIIFMVFLIFIAFAGNQEAIIPVKDNSVLQISLSQPLKDYGGKYNFVDFEYKFENYDGLNNVIDAIHFAKEDDKIKGVSIYSKVFMGGTAQAKAIRDALADFKESGKFVYAYGDFYTQKDYYLASVADSVFLNPVGEMDFRGLSSEVLFFKDIQEKSGVKMEVIRHGKYKSAVEPFLADEMSEANREQISELLGSVWSSVKSDIASSRGISVAQLDAFADELAARTPQMALDNGFVDALMYHSDYEVMLKRAIGGNVLDDVEYVSVAEYAEHASKKKKSFGKDKIAVIYAQGEIGYGKGDDNIIGQGIMIEALKEARENEKVKAIVLRVDSPGGSALASDIIWNEIELTKAVKPVVVSMGNLAASGGYYIAAGGQRIFAEPSTITGSIGVFGVVPNVHELAERWGINAEQVNTNKQSTMYSLFEPMTEDFKKVTTEGIEQVYQTFLERVAEGRNMEVSEVDRIAQGRVWSGSEALEIGLVDEIGGLDDAVAYAAELVEVSDYAVRNYPEYEINLDKVFARFGLAQSKEDIIKEEIGAEAYQVYKKLKMMLQQKGIQARIPFEMYIQ